MTLIGLAARNVLRNKLRSLLTISGVAIALVAFILLRTVISSWTAGVEHAAKDRIGTRHKISFVMPLPMRYAEEIGQIPGVKQVAYAQWFGGKDPKHEDQFFGSIAVDPRSILQVYDEVIVPPDQVESWINNKRGALVGEALAKQFGWKVGQTVILSGTIFPGNWQFEISGIYSTKRPSIDKATFFFHYSYLNDSLDPVRKDQVGWIVSRIDDPGRAADISKQIDAHFEERDMQTLSMSERALNTSFLGMVSAVLDAIDLVSVVILIIMMLVLGNTIAMGVRERTNEYGALRAIGFLPKHIALFVIGEALTIGLLGGAMGLLIGYPFVEQGLGRFLEENMGAFFPVFSVAPLTAVLAVALAIALALLAATLPAYRASKLNVIEALRRVG